MSEDTPSLWAHLEAADVHLIRFTVFSHARSASYMQIVYTGEGMMQTERTHAHARTHTRVSLCSCESKARADDADRQAAVTET